jgi:hypothetical protein
MGCASAGRQHGERHERDKTPRDDRIADDPAGPAHEVERQRRIIVEKTRRIGAVELAAAERYAGEMGIPRLIDVERRRRREPRYGAHQRRRSGKRQDQIGPAPPADTRISHRVVPRALSGPL